MTRPVESDNGSTYPRRLARALSHLGVLWLLGVGVLLLGIGLFLLLESTESCHEAGSGFACDVGRFLGATGVVLGVLRAVLALGVSKGWLWARLLGAVVALVGLIVGLGIMVSELSWVGSDVWVGWWFVPPIVAAGYAASLVSVGRPLHTTDWYRWQPRPCS